jgi:hypothetical protein
MRNGETGLDTPNSPVAFAATSMFPGHMEQFVLDEEGVLLRRWRTNDAWSQWASGL